MAEAKLSRVRSHTAHRSIEYADLHEECLRTTPSYCIFQVYLTMEVFGYNIKGKVCKLAFQIWPTDVVSLASTVLL